MNHHTWVSAACLPDGSVCENTGTGKPFVTSLHSPVGADGCVPRADATVKCEAKLECLCRVFQEADLYRGISQQRLWSFWMLLDRSVWGRATPAPAVRGVVQRTDRHALPIALVMVYIERTEE